MNLYLSRVREDDCPEPRRVLTGPEEEANQRLR